jgi:hypothetical protein
LEDRQGRKKFENYTKKERKNENKNACKKEKFLLSIPNPFQCMYYFKNLKQKALKKHLKLWV